jgi:hypothetical protein
MGGRTSQPPNMPLWLKGYFEQEALKKKKKGERLSAHTTFA